MHDAPMTANVEFEPELLPIKNAAQVLGVSVWCLRSWAYSGRVAHHKVGKLVMIHRDEIDRLIQESERPRTEDSI
jgi:excisionase family DNA binding protein